MRSTKLSAILFIEVAGFHEFLERNGERAIAALTGYRNTVYPVAAEYGGEIVDATGDELLILFDSAVAAAQCGHHVMAAIKARNSGLPPPDRIEPRAGIHLGEIWKDENHVYGNGINVAARVKAQARPWILLVSEDVFRQIENKFDLSAIELPSRELKNIERPLRLFEVSLSGEMISPRPSTSTDMEDGHSGMEAGTGERPGAAVPLAGSLAVAPKNSGAAPGAASPGIVEDSAEAFDALPPFEPLPPLPPAPPDLNMPKQVSVSMNLGIRDGSGLRVVVKEKGKTRSCYPGQSRLYRDDDGLLSDDDDKEGELGDGDIVINSTDEDQMIDPHSRAARKLGSALTGCFVGAAATLGFGYGFLMMGKSWWMAALAMLGFFIFAGNASSAGKAVAKLREIERKEKAGRG